ncbi:MAG: hypothetical protein ACFBRM_00600 [Pikeienuella sp.]
MTAPRSSHDHDRGRPALGGARGLAVLAIDRVTDRFQRRRLVRRRFALADRWLWRRDTAALAACGAKLRRSPPC